MKITNRCNLPEPFVRAVEKMIFGPPGTSGRSDISVTALIGPPRITELQRKHWDDLEEDVMDRMWALFGSAVHTVLERADVESAITEERMYIEEDGWTVSGQADRLVLDPGEVLCDYKVTSAWTMVYGGREDWTFQQNIYAEMFRRLLDIRVRKLQIVAILRDWSAYQANKSSDYPAEKVIVFDLPLWSSEEATEYIRHRIAIHRAARETGKLPECSVEDRWAKPDKWAVVKPNQKRATRVFSSEAEARSFAEEMEFDCDVRWEPGKSTRCEGYCNVAPFCDQWKKIQEAMG